MSHENKSILEAFYDQNPMPKQQEYEYLSSKIGHSHKKVKVWFQNKRAKDRREGKYELNVQNASKQFNSKIVTDQKSFENVLPMSKDETLNNENEENIEPMDQDDIPFNMDESTSTENYAIDDKKSVEDQNKIEPGKFLA